MSTSNEQVIKDAFAAWMRGDLDAYYALFADDVVLVEPASLPYGGSYKGLPAVRAGLDKMMSYWEDATVDMIEMTSGGDHVVTILDFAGTGKPTGKRVSYTIAEIWRLRDGKIVLCEPVYGDTVAAFEALGGAQ